MNRFAMFKALTSTIGGYIEYHVTGNAYKAEHAQHLNI